MLFNWVTSSVRLLWLRTPRIRRRIRLAILAILLGSAGVSSTLAGESAVRLTFSELVACPLNNPALQQQLSLGLPEGIRAAAGRPVQITGYMLPLVMENGRATQLLLMRNTLACCYGQSPAANEYVVIKTPPPGLPVTQDVPVALQGRLRIEPVTIGGALVEYFHLDDATLVQR